MKRLSARMLVPSLLLMVLSLVPSASGPQSVQPTAVTSGQSATLLSDGLWLLVGGEGTGGPRSSAYLWNPRTQAATSLPVGLHRARAWHSATVLPDGTVLILGGVGSSGRLVAAAELYRPATQTFELLASSGPSARAAHTATLLTDGRVLIAGGVGDAGLLMPDAELWDPDARNLVDAALLTTPRSGHTATLLADGSVLLWGGLDGSGLVLSAGELFDPADSGFSVVTALPPTAQAVPGTVQLAASLPADGAVDVSTDMRIVLRFSHTLRPETLTGAALLLGGPQGPHDVMIVVAEGGRLVFVTPNDRLLSGASYTLSVMGAISDAGFALPATTVRFITQSDSTSGTGADPPPGTTGTDPTSSPPTTEDTGASRSDDDESWAPGGRRGWRTGRPESPWQALTPLQASAGVTALAGQVLRLNGQPLAHVTLRIEQMTARTDDTGRFLLVGVAPGVHELVIEGQSASVPGRTYGRFEVNVELTGGETAILPYTIWMPKLDSAHAVSIPAYTTSEAVVTTPRIPGLELRIPAHTAIRDESGNTVTEVTITPIPLDRPPFPLPQGVEVPLYFTIQPGGAYVYSRSGAGARLIYPNATQAPVGRRFEFWDYEAERKGWYIYGVGAVTPDGAQVAAPPAVSIYEFTGAMVAPPANAPAQGPPPEPPPPQGDPVDPATGLFVYSKTDLAATDTLPITLTRTYRPQDSQSRPFGIGATHPYEMWLVGNVSPWTWADLVLPDGGRVHYERISPGTLFTDAVYEHTASPGRFYKSQITWNGNGWDVKLKDGTVYLIGNVAPLQAIRDRYGNQITLTRSAGQLGNITKITSPNGRFVELTYDAGNRITQAKDNIGRTASYVYDATGRLTSVTDPAGGVTQYTYDASHRMLTIRDPRNIVFLTNEYDTSDRVTQQTLADGTTYQFAYTIDGGTGKIVQTDTTNPRGFVHRTTFNTAGYSLADTRALGTAVAQSTTYVRQAGSNLVTSMTDALGRQTNYTYDTLGNVASVTRLAGTANAVATTFTYETTFNQVASITDPLNHTTTFTYNATGNPTTITNPLGHQTTLTYNAAGRPLTITTPAGTSTLAYDSGDLVSVTDPVGNMTSRFVDAVGRLVTLTTPLGQRTRYDYDALNRLTQITDALGGLTQLGYDPNGNLLAITDARGGVTSYSYNSMDRLTTRTDPLLRAESYAYDGNGNLSSFTDRKSQITSSTYDALDRLTQRTYADGSTTTYAWNAGNRLTQFVDSLSGTITHTYDGLDRLTQEATPQGTVGYTYDIAGRRSSMTVAGQLTVSYGYDNADRLTSITQGSSIVSFVYDSAGRRTTLTLPNGVTTEYTYDAASRIIGLTYKNGASVLGTLTYVHEGDGSRRQVGGTWARTGLPQPVASATYNAANQQAILGGQALTYDANGNLMSDGTNVYSWNARNQLAALTGPVPASFLYDAVGRRIRKTINGVATDILYDGLNPVREGTGAAVTNLLTGLRVDEYLMRTDMTGAHTLLTDALGSTIALADSTGAIPTAYTYEPFGASAATGVTSNNAFQYTGRENDGTSLYYYRARYYHPGAHRFISNDPLEFFGGDTNLYAYVGNRPVTLVDPLGLQALTPTDPFSATPGDCIPRCTTIDDLMDHPTPLGQFLRAALPSILDTILGQILGRIKPLKKGFPPDFRPPPADAAPPPSPALPEPAPTPPPPASGKSSG